MQSKAKIPMISSAVRDLRSSSQRVATIIQWLIFVAALLIVSFNAGCSSAAQPKPSQPVQVSVAEVACRPFGETDEFTGRVEAVNTVEVRPRVSGYLQSVHFKEGAIVRQGDLLFQIDPRPFQAEVDRLKADLAQARAQS